MYKLAELDDNKVIHFAIYQAKVLRVIEAELIELNALNMSQLIPYKQDTLLIIQLQVIGRSKHNQSIFFGI